MRSKSLSKLWGSLQKAVLFYVFGCGGRVRGLWRGSPSNARLGDLRRIP